MENHISDRNWLTFKESILKKQENRKILKKQRGAFMSEYYNRVSTKMNTEVSIVEALMNFIENGKGKVKQMFNFKKKIYKNNPYSHKEEKYNKELMMDYLRMH